MLPILKLANLYSLDKLKKKYPCLSKDEVLIDNLFLEYLSNIRFISPVYDTLQNSFYEANEILFQWQKLDQVPHRDQMYSKLFGDQIELEESTFWKSDCKVYSATEIFKDLQPLWSALLAHKIDNENMNAYDFGLYIDDMYAFMNCKTEETINYPYKLRLGTQSIDVIEKPQVKPRGRFTDDETEGTTNNEDSPSIETDKKKNRSLWLAVLIGLLLLTAGYYFFKSGNFEKKQSRSSSPDSATIFDNILVDSSQASKIILYSTVNDSEVVILPNEEPFLNKLYLQDSFNVSSVDSLNRLRGVFSLPMLDPSLYFEAIMTHDQYDEFKNIYPSFVFLYVPTSRQDDRITIKIKKTE